MSSSATITPMVHATIVQPSEIASASTIGIAAAIHAPR